MYMEEYLLLDVMQFNFQFLFWYWLVHIGIGASTYTSILTLKLLKTFLYQLNSLSIKKISIPSDS